MLCWRTLTPRQTSSIFCYPFAYFSEGTVLEKWQNQRLLSRPFLDYWLVKEVRGLYCGVGDFFLFLPAVYVTFTKLRDTTPGIFRQLANFGFSFVFSCFVI
uniref:Uncharacterized protein n=1 Tax=Populus davidiana TaxID=266767 RepID=A0A6M2EWX2_9ROSI